MPLDSTLHFFHNIITISMSQQSAEPCSILQFSTSQMYKLDVAIDVVLMNIDYYIDEDIVFFLVGCVVLGCGEL